MRLLIALLSGGLFGTGLVIAGMTDTNKVQGWLDIFGAWDPTLAFVLGGAMLPMAVLWQVLRMRKQSHAILGDAIPQVNTSAPDKPLIIGAVLFGAGWGVAGLCPGPALASLSFGGMGGLYFLGAMLAGMVMAPSFKRMLS